MANNYWELGMKIDDLGDLLLSDSWNVEKQKSSQIEIIPQAGLIKKIKDRTLNKTVYEAFATVFISELFKKYNEMLRAQDFTLYCPQAVRFEYGNPEDKNSMNSVIYEFFCPGMPLNKLDNPKERKYEIGADHVRTGERVAYLAGVVSEIFLREGLVHGDPQLRHFFLLPKAGELKDLNRDNKVYAIEPRNGLGLIDPENARVEDAHSENVKADNDKFKTRLFARFNTPQAQEYFDRGAKIVSDTNISVGGIAKEVAKQIFTSRFKTERDGKVITVKDVDMSSGKIDYD